MTAVQPIGVCPAPSATAVAEALPDAVLLHGAGLALLAVPPALAPDRAAQVRLAGRATDAADAFAPLLAPVQPTALLIDWMLAHAEGLVTALRRVTGGVEWVITVPHDSRPPPPTDSGRAYLHALATARRSTAAMRARLESLATAAAPRAHRVVETGATLDLSLLMPRTAVASTRAALHGAIADWPEARLHGPFPPYGFCALSPEETP